MNINYTIPLWGIVTVTGSLFITTTWALINMFFSTKDNKAAIKKLEEEVYYQERSIKKLKEDIEAKLNSHKRDTDNKLGDINKSVIETQTLVRLLVDNRIKFNDKKSDS